jgi:hypothetical protein
MKILKIAKKDTWSKKLRCIGDSHGPAGCYSVVLVELEDVKVWGHGDRETFFFECPLCKEQTKIQSFGLNDKLKAQIRAINKKYNQEQNEKRQLPKAGSMVKSDKNTIVKSLDVNVNKINELLQEKHIKIVTVTTIQEMAEIDNFSATLKPGKGPIKVKMSI